MNKKMKWYINRLKAMSLKEIVYRIGQTIIIKIEKIGFFANDVEKARNISSLFTKDDLNTEFFSFDEKFLENYEVHFQQNLRETTRLADRTLRDNVTIFKQEFSLDGKNLKFFSPILWPISSRNCSNIGWLCFL